MVTKTPRADRRSDALSKGRIVDTAIDVLDAEGESVRIFDALTTRLSTGVGAIYHYVANKNELLAAAADTVIARVMAEAVIDPDPRQAIRAISLGILDAIRVHPWVGTQLSREPRQAAVLQIWEGIGGQLRALGLAGPALANAGGALVNYVLGSAAQHAAGPGRLARDADRTAYLVTLAAEWEQLDPAQYPTVRAMASVLRDHDDREQFLAGVDIFLAGITSVE
jgi:AcrR family transcriptional regulator